MSLSNNSVAVITGAASGIGLSLARRIVRDNHGGDLVLVPSEHGATFDMVLG